MFRIITADENFVGEPLIAYIKVNHNRKQLQLQDSELGLSDSCYSQQSNQEFINDELLLAPTSQLVDEGYGTFERIYSVLKCVNGDLSSARECLSLLMFHEC